MGQKAQMRNSESLSILPDNTQLAGGGAAFEHSLFAQSPGSFPPLYCFCLSHMLSHPGPHVQQEARPEGLLPTCLASSSCLHHALPL